MTILESRPAPKELAPDHGQAVPGRQSQMKVQPDSDLSTSKAAGMLAGKTALVTNSDSGIGRAVAMAFALEGADVAIAYDQSDADADEMHRLVEARRGRCVVLKDDVGVEDNCARFVRETVDAFGRLDVLVNNAALLVREPFEHVTARASGGTSR